MQPSSGGFFSIQFFSTEVAAFVMPILFPDCCEYTWYPCASHMFFDELCCFYAAAMLLVLLHGAETCSGRGARNINSCILIDSLNIN
jgi:hypothetical protein